MELKIEKGVPLPPKASARPRNAIYYRMEVGDSVLVPNRVHDRVASTVSYVAKTTGFKFATRKVEGGIRVWRTA